MKPLSTSGRLIVELVARQRVAQRSAASSCAPARAMRALAPRICDCIAASCSSSVRRRASNSSRSRARAHRAAAHVGRPVDLSAPGQLGAGALGAQLLGIDLLAQQVERGIAAHVADHQQRIAAAHVLALAHQQLAHDAAFLVLHRLAAQLGLHLAGRDHGAGQRRPARTTADEHACTRPPAAAAATRAARAVDAACAGQRRRVREH